MTTKIYLFLAIGLIACQIFTADGISSKGGPNFHPDQHVQFVDKIRDWFKNMKSTIFGTKHDTYKQPPYDSEIFDMNEEEIKNMKMSHPKEFFLDLRHIQFNPEEDWGFRIGNWLIIHKYTTYIYPGDLSQPEEASEENIYDIEIPDEEYEEDVLAEEEAHSEEETMELSAEGSEEYT